MSDDLEAASRRYSNDVIIVLPLSSGNYAIFNSARTLCGIVEGLQEWPPACWFAPEAPKPHTVDLKELGLL